MEAKQLGQGVVFFKDKLFDGKVCIDMEDSKEKGKDMVLPMIFQSYPIDAGEGLT